jgi:hypothetical protein
MIIYAKHMWPDAIDASLWLYAIRLSCNIDNSTIRNTTYVLTNHDGLHNSKWDPRARIGIYIGPSPKHARSVHLILNPSTGLTSPQYHVRFDNLFRTTTNMHVRFNWKERCHFVKLLTDQYKVQ